MATVAKYIYSEVSSTALSGTYCQVSVHSMVLKMYYYFNIIVIILLFANDAYYTDPGLG